MRNRSRETRRSFRSVGLGLGLLALLLPVAAAPRPPQEPPPAEAGSQAAEPASPVERVRLLKRDGGRLDWSVQGDSIAFDQRGSDGFYDLYVTSMPEGRGEQCLTCAHPEFRKAHAFNPVWHPSGQVLAFQVQEHAGKLRLSPAGLTSPDRGLHSELWVISRDGRRPWRLTRVGERGGALLDPCFSHEGDRLAWSERVRSREGRWGEWVVRAGRFRLQGAVPRLSGVDTWHPGKERRLVLASAFAPDDRRLLLAGEVAPGPSASAGMAGGLDLYSLDLASGAVTALVTTPDEWDEQPRLSPRGDHLAFTSSRGLPAGPRLGQLGQSPTARPVPRELWLMKVDGTGRERLTSFNASAGTGAGAVVSDFAWSPDGGSLAVHVVEDVATGEEAIYLVELAPRFRR